MNKLDLLYTERNNVKRKIKERKRYLNKLFVEKNKNKVRLLDLLFLCVILFNIGAMVMTNMMVVKAEPQKEFKEANPFTGKLQNLETHEKSRAFEVMKMFLKQSFIWWIILVLYISLRKSIYCIESYYFLLFVTLWLFISTGRDFISDFGFVLGKVIYGGII